MKASAEGSVRPFPTVEVAQGPHPDYSLIFERLKIITKDLADSDDRSVETALLKTKIEKMELKLREEAAKSLVADTVFPIQWPLNRYIDHTVLKADATKDDVQKLCEVID